MVARNALAVGFCTGFLAFGGLALADEYRPNEFLGLDLSEAVLSPKRLGPPTEFAPVPIEAEADRGTDAAQVGEEPEAEPQPAIRKTRTAHVRAEPKGELKTAGHQTRVAHVHAELRARAKLARRHGSPLDAQAQDTRIQVWPCKSGGICNWQR